ncbi:diguanylate cyclase [Devosia sp. PTR5]|uniref:diguanylate cyclase n=1 Tax=Devosia oryzisoli TaxID=2774138 RepID=A0A927IU70_9HYPH|nr:diguanylate cyclase [Devosia oryzisoli]MBD8066617.1 diguanylate cyclase [Devosia oryzisoli]
MSAALFVLAINLFVAALFAIAFGVVAAAARSNSGPRWLALGYGFGMLDVLLEFILPSQADPAPASIGIFLSFLFAVSFTLVGLARHYRVPLPRLPLGLILGLSVIGIVFIIDMPRSSLLRGTLYQLPYSALHLLGAFVVLGSGRRQPLDRVLIALLVFTSVQFLLKPWLAVILGSGATAQAYLGTTYAALSQTLGAVALIAIGLTTLLILMRDLNAETAMRAETDTLSGLLNRRGFEERGDRAMAALRRAGRPAVMVAADLDHFKSINDAYGHAAGDEVIRHFAGILADVAGPSAIVARMGGEEFAVLVVGANLSAGRLMAEAARVALSASSFDETELNRRVTASFGLAQLQTNDTLWDLLRRADRALYRAKAEGRDRVAVALDDAAVQPLANSRSPGGR